MLEQLAKYAQDAEPGFKPRDVRWAIVLDSRVGFVGLVVPHAVRLVLGPDHRLLLPAAALAGASFLVIADLLSRTLLAPVEIPVGVITAIIGAPFFIYLLRRTRKEYAL